MRYDIARRNRLINSYKKKKNWINRRINRYRISFDRVFGIHGFIGTILLRVKPLDEEIFRHRTPVHSTTRVYSIRQLSQVAHSRWPHNSKY